MSCHHCGVSRGNNVTILIPAVDPRGYVQQQEWCSLSVDTIVCRMCVCVGGGGRGEGRSGRKWGRCCYMLSEGQNGGRTGSTVGTLSSNTCHHQFCFHILYLDFFKIFYPLMLTKSRTSACSREVLHSYPGAFRFECLLRYYMDCGLTSSALAGKYLDNID